MNILQRLWNHRQSKSPAEERAERWTRESKAMVQKMDDYRQELLELVRRSERLLVQFKKISGDVDQLLQTQEDIQVRYNSAMDGLRQELQVSNDVLVPALTAAVKKVQQTMEADTAIQVARETNFRTPRQEFQD